MDLYRTLTGQSTRSQQTDQSNQTHQVPTQNTSKDPLAGHLNHLSEHQEAALSKFKSTLQEQGLWKPGGPEARPSHDDATLLRYLRARKFDVKGAVGQFSDTEHWLKEQKVEELYEHFDVDFYERARKMYPQWTGHRDRRGIPLYVYVIKHLDSKNVNAYVKEAQAYKSKMPNHKSLGTPAKLLPLFALYHNLLNFVLPMVSTLDRPNPEVPVTNSTNIVDISGVGLHQFWNLKAHMQDASVLATAHYPETLDRIFIIGAPSFFPTVWGWIKRWFDPVTVSKIFILGKHEIKSTLLSFIDSNDLPKHYGGNLDWEFNMVPHMDEASMGAVERDGRKGWIEGPCLWLNHQRFAVGTVDGKTRRPDSEIAALKPVVFAADGTEEPVHAGKVQGKGTIANATVEVNGTVVPAGAGRPLTPDNTKSDVSSAIPLAATVPSQAKAPAQPSAENVSTLTTQQPSHVQKETSVPEYITGTEHHVSVRESLVNDVTTKKMQEESISIIPKLDNGTVHRPELIVASDPTKGLVLPTEKVSVNGAAKPPMERFVTAREDVSAVYMNGRV